MNFLHIQGNSKHGKVEIKPLIAKKLSNHFLADGTLRLYGGNTRYEGILEIYHSNRWGSICDDGWNSVASIVACRQMGYPGYSSYITSRTITNDFWLDDVRCSGGDLMISKSDLSLVPLYFVFFYWLY